MSTAIKICKNCRHFFNESGFALAMGKCKLARTEKPMRTDLINGKIYAPTTEYSYTHFFRNNGKCGKEGTLYEREPSKMQAIRNAYGVPATFMAKNIMLCGVGVGLGVLVGASINDQLITKPKT